MGVLDRLKKGCVKWKKVSLKGKHKFDHVLNCNYVVDLCSNELGLELVNVAGIDIVDRNAVMIKSILWRIMRYQSIKILSDLQFGGKFKNVNNAEITKWCNQKLTEAFGDKMRCKLIKRLTDTQLTTGIYYLELIRAIMPNAIKEELINLDVPPLNVKSIRTEFSLQDKHYKKRRENLIYCTTIIRRYGVDLFVNLDDMLRLESRAVVSILAALMTISLSEKHILTKEKEEEQGDNIEVSRILYDVAHVGKSAAEDDVKTLKKEKEKANTSKKIKTKDPDDSNTRKSSTKRSKSKSPSPKP